MEKYLLLSEDGDLFTDAINAENWEDAIEEAKKMLDRLAPSDRKRYTSTVVAYTLEDAIHEAIEEGDAETEEEAEKLFSGKTPMYIANAVTETLTLHVGNTRA